LRRILPAPAPLVSLVGARQGEPGRLTARRLNRSEYDNSLRGLLAVDFQPADDFPQDDSGYGFDNVGDFLMIALSARPQPLAATPLMNADTGLSKPTALNIFPGARFAGMRHHRSRCRGWTRCGPPCRGDQIAGTQGARLCSQRRDHAGTEPR
jgi:hypothetical protein